MAYISQRQFTVSITGGSGGIATPGVWMTKGGGDLAADSNKIYPGGQKVPVIITGISEVDNITVGRAFETDRDRPMLKALRAAVGTFTATITMTDTDADFVSSQNNVVYSNSVLVGITEPEYDSASGDPAMIELEFAIPSVTST